MTETAQLEVFSSEDEGSSLGAVTVRFEGDDGYGNNWTHIDGATRHRIDRLGNNWLALEVGGGMIAGEIRLAVWCHETDWDDITGSPPQPAGTQ